MANFLIVAAALTNLAGVVTFARENLPYFFMCEPNGAAWRVSMPEGAHAPMVGDVVEVAGEREFSVKNRIADAMVSVTTNDVSAIPPPLVFDVATLFSKLLPFGNTGLYGALVSSEGMLRDINRRQNSTQLLVGEGDCNFQVELPVDISDSLPDDFKIGATVRVTGILAYTSIENIEEGIFGRIENIEIIPPSADSVEIVKRAPFWTPARIWAFVGWLVVLLAVLFGWVAALRGMVAKKTAELAESIRLRVKARVEADAARRERLRLAADLHDGFQQYLAGAVFRLKAALNYLPDGARECREQLLAVQDALQHTQAGLRATLWAMNEESEGPESLMELFGFAARRMPHWENTVEFSSEGEERPIAHKYAGSLLLILQEAVGNALKHGAAKHVKVHVAFEERGFALSVTDDGKGFDPSAARPDGHYGISGMERRASELGGTTAIESAPGKGTTITFRIPL